MRARQAFCRFIFMALLLGNAVAIVPSDSFARVALAPAAANANRKSAAPLLTHASVVTARTPTWVIANGKNWRSVPTSFPGRLFAKANSPTKQMMLIFIRDLANAGAVPVPELVNLRGELAAARARRLESVGFQGYALQAAEVEHLHATSSLPNLLMESTYLGLRGQNVQMVERQYFLGSHVYNVVYTEETSAIRSRVEVRAAMDGFVPNLNLSSTGHQSDRSPAGETVQAIPKSSSATRPSGPDAAVNEEAALKLELSRVRPDDQLCAIVPLEKRRQATATAIDKIEGYGTGCAYGVVMAVPGMVEDLWSGTKALVYVPAAVAKGAYAYATDENYFEATNASAVVAFESFKDPQALSKRIFRAGITFVSQSVDRFACLNERAQAQVVCKFLSQLAVGGAALKVIRPLLQGGRAALVAQAALAPGGSATALTAAKVAANKALDELLGIANPDARAERTMPRLDRENFERLQRFGRADEEAKARALAKTRPDQLNEAVDDLGLTRSQRAYSDLPALKGRPHSAIEDSLKNSEIVLRKGLNQGVNATDLVTLKDGTLAVWKPHVEIWSSNYRAEVLAYEFDRKLGFNLVPETVERVENGKKGSLQLYKKAGRNVRAKPLELDKQGVFDYLIRNTDRHDGNYLIGADGKVVSIDHGQSFIDADGQKIDTLTLKRELERVFQTPQGHQIMSHLRESLQDSEFKSQVQEYLGNEDTHRLFERMQNVVKDYGDQPLKSPPVRVPEVDAPMSGPRASVLEAAP